MKETLPASGKLAPLLLPLTLLMTGACQETRQDTRACFPLTEKTFEENKNSLPNPERGFFGEIDLMERRGFEKLTDKGQTLGFAPVDLAAYRDSQLDDAFLEKLEEGFAGVREAGIKVILRFRYNEGPWPESEPDAPKAMVLNHLSQLSPLLHKHSDVIAVMQAGFIGAWGEWHSSTEGLDNTKDQRDILMAILEALPASRMTQVRQPDFKRALFGAEALSEKEAFSDLLKARVGHHDDCLLADSVTAPDQLSDEDLTYLKEEGRFTPMGGETCALNPPLTNCRDASLFLEGLHLSFLNHEWNPQVIDQWLHQGCYTEIHRRLGYRLILERASFPEKIAAGDVLPLLVDLRNDGFAAPFNERPLYVVLDGSEGRFWANLEAVDLRRLEPGPHHFEAFLKLPKDVPAGHYQLGLAMLDAALSLQEDSRYHLRFLNRNTWDPSTYIDRLGDLQVNSDPPQMCYGPGTAHFQPHR